MKWGLVAAVAVILLLVAVSFITGMIPGFGKQANATASSGDKDSGTTPAVTTTAPATVQTTAPAKTTTAVAAPAITANASATKAANASATATANATVTVTANATPAATPTLPLADASRPLPMGQGGYDGRGNLTVNDIAWKDRMSDPIPSYAIGKKYLIVNITYENLQQNGTVDADLSMLVLKDGGGFPFEPASDGMLESPWTGKAIGPKEKRTGNLLFIVPPEATLMKLYYTYGAGKTAAFTIT